MHIMDIAENGLDAGAGLIKIFIREDSGANLLEIKIADNGRGIPEDLVSRVDDPFFTTRKARPVGLGMGLLKEASRRCEGEFHVRSRVGEGTEVTAAFKLDHIDLPPRGDLGGALTALIAGNSEADFVYVHRVNGDSIELDTREMRRELGDIPISNPEVLRQISQSIRRFTSGL